MLDTNKEDAAFRMLSIMVKGRNIQPDTALKYHQVLSVFLGGTRKPFLMTQAKDIEAYLSELTSSGMKGSTIRLKLGILHSVFENCVRFREELDIPDELILVNPFTSYLPKDESDEVEEGNVASFEEVEVLLEKKNGDVLLQLAIVLALKMLLRLREIIAIKVSDIFETEYEGETILALRIGTGLMEHDLLVPSDIRDLLLEVREKADCCPDNVEGWLFYAERAKNGRYTANAFQARLYRAARKLGLSDSVNFNAIRNLGISMCRSDDEILFDHLCFADARHRRRVENIRKIGGKVGLAGKDVSVRIILDKRYD